MLQVAIVDDHEIVRAGLREMLAGEQGIAIAFEVASGEEALSLLPETPCDVLLLDLVLPGQSGVDILRTLRQRHPELRVLVLSAYPEERYALTMIRHGADGYLCKGCNQEELLQAVRALALGRRYLSPRMSELLADEVAGNNHGVGHQQLSERELQVFLHLAQGQSVSEIGRALHLSIKTVSTYRSRLLDKLGVNSNAQLATYALRNGLIAD